MSEQLKQFGHVFGFELKYRLILADGTDTGGKNISLALLCDKFIDLP